MKDLVNSGVNIVALEKKGHLFGMTCAWMMQVDEDQLLMLLGSQSETANILKEGDIIGVNALALGQEEIAKKFGTTHSKKINKFNNLSFENEDGAILINRASKMMKCEIIKIDHLIDNDEDYLVHVKVLSMVCNNDNFMSMISYRKYLED